MQLSHHWEVEGQAAYFHISGIVTIEDLVTLNTLIIHYLDQADEQKIHCIFSVDGLLDFPHKLREVNQAMTFNKHPHMGSVIILRPSKLVSFISTVVSAMSNIQSHRVANIAEARKLVEKLTAHTS